MANLRIIADNAIDRATLSSPSTASGFSLASLQSQRKSDVWRSANLGARLSAAWAVAENIQAVAMPFCNLSPTATIRVRTTLEAQATNLLTYSQQFDNAVWNKGTGGSVTADAILAPDGTLTAESYTHATSTSYFAYLAQAATGDASQAWTYSLWVKVPSGTATIRLMIGNVSGVTKQGSAATVTTSWQRISFTLTAGQVANTGQVGAGIAGAAGQAYHVWGAQLETGPVATSYYPTTSAPATRPLGYIDSWQSYSYDSGSVQACPAPALLPRGFTAAQAASAYAFGGGACLRHWLPSAQQAFGLALDITDNNNLQGYVESAALVAGSYWSPTYNTSTVSSTDIDASTHYRTDAGDLMTRASTTHKRVPIELEYMPATDRALLANILRGSRSYPIFLSVFPGHADLALERDHTVYGKRMSDSEVAVQAAINYGAKIEVESI